MNPEIYTIVDVETTGKGINGNRVTEFCAVRIEDGVIVDKFTSLVNPEQYIPQFITSLTGINDAMVSDAPLFSDIAARITEITTGAIFIAHNVNFDYNVLRGEFKRLGATFARKKLCTVRLSRKLFPGLFSYSLGNLCASLNIALNNRHRAEGDTDATVILFKRILELDPDRTLIKTFLNTRSKEATLPPHLSTRILQELPESSGIYLFKDRKGKVIYVGKAINIKKRVLSHFYDKKNKEYLLGQETYQIDHEVTGNELCALLLESEYIQQYFPRYNRAQKMPTHTYAIISYENRKGILQITITKTRYRSAPNQVLYNKVQALAKVSELCVAFELCPKYCSLQTTTGPCSHYSIVTCKGVCSNTESIENYNARVKDALLTLHKENESYIIKENGRTADEEAFILVKDGVYKGFGFVGSDEQIQCPEDLETYLLPKKNTHHTGVILRSYFKKKKTPKIIKLDVNV